MAEDKTEKPTPKRKRQARERGQVAKSIEVNNVVVLLAGFVALSFLGSRVVNGAAAAMQTIFGLVAHPDMVSSATGLHTLVSLIESTLESTVAPIVAVCLAGGLLANIAQVGLRPSLKAIKPDFRKISPVSGAKNVFGQRALFELGKVLAKVAVVGTVAAMSLVPQITHLAANVGTTPLALGSLLSSGAKSIAERAVIAYLLIAVVDLLYQRRRHGKQLKMTKQEVKDEFRQTQLPPEVRSALKRRQILAARARMMTAVPGADVVVTNPTHYAVALRYDGSLPAPVVVAKGKNLVAAQIRRIAAENDVPIVPDPPLARSLHAAVEIDRMIPAELYAAVAQVLAFVYRMAARKRIAV